MSNDVERCRICDWPIRATVADGCTKGSCSYRPDDGSPEWHRIQRRRESVRRTDAFLAMSREEQSEYILAKLEARGESVQAFLDRLSEMA